MKKVIYLVAASALLLSFTVVSGMRQAPKKTEQNAVKTVKLPEIQGTFIADENQFK